jgi:hypothetical protein
MKRLALRPFGSRKLVVIAAALVMLLAAPSVWRLQNARALTYTAADKVAIAGSDLDIINQTQVANASSATTSTIFDSSFKTSTTEDLVMNVSAECGLYTAVGAKGGGSGSTTSSTATGVVTISLVLDGKPVPTTLTPNPIPNPSFGNPSLPADGNGPVVYCGRGLQMDTSNLGLNEMISLFENTRSANSFQWFALNVGNGTHHLLVYATLQSSTASSGTNGGSGSTVGTPAAAAMIGQRTLTVDPHHLANSATF